MGKDNVKKMFAKLGTDSELQKKYSKLMHDHSCESEKKLSDNLIKFGESNGFSFTKDDLLSARAELANKMNENKELSDCDLSSVAGGDGNKKFLATVLSISGLGVACAFVSVVEAIKNPNGCGKILTTTDKNC